ncbi:MAG: hypothetical protein ACK2T3_15740, partial [Candidatus Promineifilaceae bacterium]
YKSKEGMSLGSEIGSLILSGIPKEQIELFTEIESDLQSVTRARELTLSEEIGVNGVVLGRVGHIEVSLIS